MKWNVCFMLFFPALFLGISGTSPVFRFANIYGNHMVLQKAPHRAMIWGFGEFGQKVLLTVGRKLYSSEIKQGPNNAGIWSVILNPYKYGGPYTIRASSSVNGEKVTITLRNVLFGDVWICGGQSNMEMAVRTTTNGELAIKKSNNYHQVRLFTADRATSNTPLSELKGIREPWSIASPKTVGGSGNIKEAYFSATCWYYGIQLYNKLKYPIGLVALSWMGTPIESWSSPDALRKCNIHGNVLTPRGMKLTIKAIGAEALKHSHLWNAMIHPFLKMTIYGAIWYQGEINAVLGVNPYYCTFPAMIDDWRAKWFEATQGNTQERFPFGFVQISAVGKDTTSQARKFAPFRWNQTAHYGYVPNYRLKNVFMAVAMDLGNPYSPFHSSHPTNKKDVGTRLALGAFSVAYGKNVYYSGPLVSEIKQQKEHSLIVMFKSVRGKIEVRSFDGFEVLCLYWTKWIKAKIIKSGPKSVIIRPSADCEVEAVRYAWSDYPCVMKECAIYSGNLPCPPFIKYGPFSKDWLSTVEF